MQQIDGCGQVVNFGLITLILTLEILLVPDSGFGGDYFEPTFVRYLALEGLFHRLKEN